MPQGQRDPKRPPKQIRTSSFRDDDANIVDVSAEPLDTVTTPPPPPPATAVKERQVITREFTHVTPAPALASEAYDDPEGEADDQLPPGFSYVDDDEGDEDPIARFMHSIGGEDLSGLRVSIKRMPDTFETRGKFATPSTTEIQHGDIAFDPDNLINNIRDTLGGGRYRLSIKKGSGQFFTRPIEVTVADPPGSGPVNAPTLRAPVREPKPTDAVDELIKQANKMNQLKEALGIPSGNGGGNAAASDPDTVLATALIKNPQMIETVVSGIVGKFGGKSGGESERDPWYKELLMMFVRNEETAALLVHGGFGLLSGLTELAKKAAGTLSTTPQPNPVATAPPPPRTAQPQTLAPAPGEEHGGPDVNDEDDDTPEHLKVLDFLIKDKLANNVAVTADEEWIADMYDRWPDEIAQAETMLLNPMLKTKTLKMILVGIDPAYQEMLDLEHADLFFDNLREIVRARKGER